MLRIARPLSVRGLLGLSLVVPACNDAPREASRALDAAIAVPAAAPIGRASGATAASERPGPRFLPAPAGEVATLVREAAAEETARGRRLVVYVGAAWCEPCRRFHRAVEAGELDAQFAGLTLLEFDLDRDAERLRAASYTSTFIPLFAIPAPDGVASGRQIAGAVKGDGAVAVIVPRLANLLRQ